jgi:predicted 3-demethylubiquinone-9 3-methyltransferase (glyoxalase superfamily)
MKAKIRRRLLIKDKAQEAARFYI